jgi:hypothetical protein
MSALGRPAIALQQGVHRYRDGVAVLAYLRTYDAPDGVTLSAEPLPEWFSAHVQLPYIASRAPSVALQRQLNVEVLEQPLQMQQLALHFPHLRLVQLLFWIDDMELDTPIADGLLPFAVELPAAAGESFSTSGEHSAADVLDLFYSVLTGHAVGDVGPRRTDFGAIVFGDIDTPTPELQHLGSFMNSEVRGAAYDLQVIGPDACSREVFDRVIVVSSVLGRARHLRKRLIETISDTADSVLNEAMDPWRGVRSTSQIQAENILFRREMNGEGFLNRAATKELLRCVSPALQVPKDHLEDLTSASESLDALSQSLFGLAIEDAQRRFGWYGLFFAALSILFATFATVDVADSAMATRAWVMGAVAWAAALWFVVHRTMRRRFARR